MSVIEYFAAGNTARGLTVFYDSVFQDMKKIYVLDGEGNRYKTKTLKMLADQYEKLYDIDIVKSSIDNDELEAVLVSDLEIAIVNGNLIHGHKFDFENVDVCSININDAIDMSFVDKFKCDYLISEIYSSLNDSYKAFEKSLKIHDDIEGFYYKYMDFDKANFITKEFINNLFENKVGNGRKVYHRYLGAATPSGAIDCIPSITFGLKKYFLKGRAGTGKSTFLKKIVSEGTARDFVVEAYHCGFDPNSLDMVVIRELGIAIFDSTAPHEYFPNSLDDEVIDTYSKFCIADVDSIFKNELFFTEGDYLKFKKDGVTYLKNSKKFKDEYDDIFDKALNKEVANKIVKGILPIV